MKKKLIAAMLAAFMLLALALPAAAADGDAEAAPVSRTGFSDVVVGAWYEDAVDWAVDEGIVLGIGDGLFGVGQELTLAQMDTMLCRAAGLPETAETSAQPADRLTAVTAIWERFGSGETAACPFADVTENAGAVGWAYDKGITKGVSDTAFSPGGPLTREQFVTMLYRWRWQEDGYVDRTVGVFRETLTDETATVRYFADARSIAYMCIEDYYAVMLPGYSMSVEQTGDGQYTLTNPCGSAVVDVTADTLRSDDYAAFTNLMWQIQEGMDNIYLDGYPFIRVVGATYSDPPKPVTFLFGEKYGIDLRADGGHVYFPLATLSDMFSNMDYLYSSYNGVNLYVNADNDMDFMYERDPAYYDPILCAEKRDAELADFNYRELCFVFDYLYGYPGRGILYEEAALEQVGLDRALEDFGPIGTRTKELLLSSDWVDYFMGTIRLNTLLDDGGHTSLGVMSGTDIYSNPARAWLQEKLSGPDVYPSYFSDMMELMMRKTGPSFESIFALMELRTEILGEGRFFTKGDTALYSMNGFVADKAPWKEYYANGGSFDDFDEPVFMGLISAMNKAQADPDIKNFVIDLSANGGGSADVLMALYSLITGEREVVLTYQSVLQGQDITQTFLVDRNFDGKFDEADADVHYDLNFAVLATQESYSCGNLFPSMMKDLGYMVLGERSGGGACTILGLNTADGFYYHTSSYEMRLTNAAGEVIDAGIEPDVVLVRAGADGVKDYSDCYDLELLSGLMNEFYGEKEKNAVSYEKESATAYLYAKDKTAEITLLKDPTLPGAAWIDVMDFLKYDYNDQVRFEIARDGDVYTVTKKNNGVTGEDVNVTMVIDAAKDTVTFPQMEMFIIGEDAYKDPGTVVDNPYVQELQPEYAAGSTVSSAVYDLAKYGFDVVADGDAVYLPTVILSDIFGFNYNSAEYVDGCVYFVHAGDEVGPDPSSPYVDKTAIYNLMERDEKEIAFAYNAICFVMDELYGCPPHNVFSENIRALGFDRAAELDADLSHIKNDYLKSPNRIDYYQGLNYLTAVFGDFGHTSMASGLTTLFSVPAYAETELVKAWSDPARVPAYPEDADKYNALIAAAEMWKGSLYMARAMAYTGNPNTVKETDDTSYVVVGDKAFFAFDRFKAAVLPDLKEALDHAAANGVRDFYFDLSCNGGGDERVAAYLMDLITGDGTFYYTNAKTGNRVAQRIKADLNQDGVFDEKDDAVSYNFNYKIITSKASFSSGNLLPCLAELAGIPIYGERSGGGTCFVMVQNHSDTMALMFSGASTFARPDTWANLEAGASVTEEWVTQNPDGSTDYSHLYDVMTSAS